MRGGGWGFTGSSSFPGQAGTVSNPMVYTGIGDCRAVKPGYDIPYSQYGASLKGLPGMSGGARRMNKSRKMRKQRTKKHKQRGGRYGFFPESAGTVTPNGGAWWAATYGPVQRIACEGGSPNPLNPTHTPSSAPPGAVNPNYYLGKQMGGAQQLAPSTVGVGDVDSMYYYAPTAGYANTASTWRDSVGAPVQIQVPFAARAMNQACLTTGGAPPLTGALQKGGRRRTYRGGNGANGSGSGAEAAGAGPGAAGAGPGAAGAGPGAGAAAPAPAAGIGGILQGALSQVATAAQGAVGAVQGAVSTATGAVTSAVRRNGVTAPAPVTPMPPGAGAGVGGRRRRHRKHKKGTHKGRKH
jgi:hypothetical protein